MTHRFLGLVQAGVALPGLGVDGMWGHGDGRDQLRGSPRGRRYPSSMPPSLQSSWPH